MGSFECEMIDRCLSDPCAHGFKCVNSALGYECLDIDECQLQMFSCQEGFKCVNSEGAYSCKDIDECLFDICDS